MTSQINYAVPLNKKPRSLRSTRFAFRRCWIRKLRVASDASPEPTYLFRTLLLKLIHSELLLEKRMLRKASQVMQRMSS